MSKQELRLAGSGGQGVILATVILAEAAILAGKYTAQSQSYGPEARGGSCKAETLISDDPIGFTKVQRPTFLMALTQKSLDTYTANLPEDCLVLIDDTLTAPASIPEHKLVRLPILATAKEKVGRLQTANIVAVGCINRLLHIVNREAIEQAVMMHIPKGTEELNLKALEEGERLAAEYETKVPAGAARPAESAAVDSAAVESASLTPSPALPGTEETAKTKNVKDKPARKEAKAAKEDRKA